jgi:hypothetical protein
MARRARRDLDQHVHRRVLAAPAAEQLRDVLHRVDGFARARRLHLDDRVPHVGVVPVSVIAVVTGSRKGRDEKLVEDTLDRVHDEHTIAALVQGGADGFDALAQAWADRNAIPSMKVPAAWGKGSDYDPRAGLERNREMLDWANVLTNFSIYVSSVVLVRFPGNRGTRDCAEAARDMGIRIISAEAGRR